MEIADIFTKIRQSMTLKLIVIAILLLLLQIPVLMVGSLINQRMNAKKAAEQDISKGWGREQLIAGPYLVIPAEIPAQSDKKPRRVQRVFQMPETLSVNGKLIPQIRYRGIYKVALYTAELKIRARFKYDLPNYAECKPERTRLCFRLTDIIGIRKCEISVNGKKEKIRSGVSANGKDSVIQVNVPQTGNSGAFEAEIDLVLNGNSSFLVSPVGQESEIQLTSSWADPRFFGSMLPAERKIGPDGFSAKWLYSALNRSFPEQWMDNEFRLETDSCKVGVQLKLMTDIYTQVDRAIKYVTLFMIFIMLFFLVGEHLSGVWMHPFQYLLSGLAIVLFYLLLLSISEHLYFDFAFLIAALAVSALAACYTGAIFRSSRVAWGQGIAMLCAYAVIYLLLKLENTALLVGSGVLFVLLALLMALTADLNKKES